MKPPNPHSVHGWLPRDTRQLWDRFFAAPAGTKESSDAYADAVCATSENKFMASSTPEQHAEAMKIAGSAMAGDWNALDRYANMQDDDGQPDEAQEWNDYDPEC